MGGGPSLPDSLSPESTAHDRHSFQLVSPPPDQWQRDELDKLSDKAWIVRTRYIFDVYFFFGYSLVWEDTAHELSFCDPRNFYSSVVQLKRIAAPVVIPKKRSRACSLSPEAHERMHRILGFTGFSFMYRNSEHVVNFILTGVWFNAPSSEHVFKDIDPPFLKSLLEPFRQTHLINYHPVGLESTFTVTDTPFNQDLVSIFRWKDNFSKYDHKPTDFNVLLLGPTGSGKSMFLNLLVNQLVAESKAQAGSVTKSTTFFNCTLDNATRAPEPLRNRRIVIADTIGLCDSELNAQDVHQIIQEAIESNEFHLNLVIVLLNKRAQKEEIASVKQMLSWLHYKEKRQKFLFLINQTGPLPPHDLQRLLTSLVPTYDIFLGLTTNNQVQPAGFCVDTMKDSDSIQRCHDVVLDHINTFQLQDDPICFRQSEGDCTLF